MPVGFKLPLQLSSTGGFDLVDSDENDFKIIKTALMNDENENAFQQNMGLGNSAIFKNNDSAQRSSLNSRLRMIFKNFEQQKRYKLLPSTVKWSTNPTSHELILEFRFISLESDEEKTFTNSFFFILILLNSLSLTRLFLKLK